MLSWLVYPRDRSTTSCLVSAWRHIATSSGPLRFINESYSAAAAGCAGAWRSSSTCGSWTEGCPTSGEHVKDITSELWQHHHSNWPVEGSPGGTSHGDGGDGSSNGGSSVHKRGSSTVRPRSMAATPSTGAATTDACARFRGNGSSSWAVLSTQHLRVTTASAAWSTGMWPTGNLSTALRMVSVSAAAASNSSRGIGSAAMREGPPLEQPLGPLQGVMPWVTGRTGNRGSASLSYRARGSAEGTAGTRGRPADSPTHGAMACGSRAASGVRDRLRSSRAGGSDSGPSPGKRGSSSAKGLHPAQLMCMITGCTDLPSLMRLVEQHSASFNYMHAAAALSKAPKLVGSRQVQTDAPARGSVKQLVAVAQQHLQACGARQLANMVWAVAKLGHRDERFVGQIVGHARSKLQDFEPQALANTVWALATLEHHDPGLTQLLLREAKGKLEHFTPQALANTVWALATLEHHDPVFLQLLLKEASDKLKHFNPQALANTIWALARLEHDPGFVQLLLTEASGKLEDFTPQNLANTIWALATLRHHDPGFVQQLLREVSDKLKHFTPQALANTVWALATLEHHDPVFLQLLLKEASDKLKHFNPQALANTIWALARLEHDPGFVQLLLTEASGKLEDFTPQNLANTIWALATLRHHDPGFVQLLLREVSDKLKHFSPQHLANTVWALATLEHHDPAFVQLLLREASSKLKDFNPQHLANTVWALGRLQVQPRNPDLLPRLLTAACDQLPHFNSQGLSNTALGLAWLRHHDPLFLQQLLAAAGPKLTAFIPQNLANMALALATLNHNNAPFTDSLLQHVALRLGSLNYQEICNTLWSLCILDHDAAAAAPTVEALLRAVGEGIDLGVQGPKPEALQQVYQYLVTAEGRGHISTPLQQEGWYQRLRRAGQSAWEQRLKLAAPSHTQRQVLAAVRLLPGCEGAQSEHVTEDGLLSVDVAVLLPGGRKVAVEVDGPTHFMSNVPGMLNGSTTWRNLMLQQRGWAVVSVPVVEWQRLGGDARRQRAYLLQKLGKAAGQQLSVACNGGCGES